MLFLRPLALPRRYASILLCYLKYKLVDEVDHENNSMPSILPLLDGVGQTFVFLDGVWIVMYAIHSSSFGWGLIVIVRRKL